jgi:hypothetical protein
MHRSIIPNDSHSVELYTGAKSIHATMWGED